MHLFDSELFWSQLKDVCKPTTKILFNLVSDKIKHNNLIIDNAYMKYQDNKIIYFFPWAHTKETNENYISKEELNEKLDKFTEPHLYLN